MHGALPERRLARMAGEGITQAAMSRSCSVEAASMALSAVVSRWPLVVRWYRKFYALGMHIFEVTKPFPPETLRVERTTAPLISFPVQESARSLG